MCHFQASLSGAVLGRGIHRDSVDHYKADPVSLDPKWHIKNLGDIDQRSSQSLKVKLMIVQV